MHVCACVCPYVHVLVCPHVPVCADVCPHLCVHVYVCRRVQGWECRGVRTLQEGGNMISLLRRGTATAVGQSAGLR